MNIGTAYNLLQSMPGGVTEARIQRLTTQQPVWFWLYGVLCQGHATAPEHAKMIEVADEQTGQRYGKAKCRSGCAIKVGSGGRNKKSTVPAYQIWCVWE